MLKVRNGKIGTEWRRVPLFWKMLALNLVFALLLIWYFVPYYETDDDFAFLALSSGFYGEPQIGLVFSNVILGVILKALASVSTAISWYWVLAFGATVLAYTVIGTVLVEKLGKRYGSFFFLVFLIVTGYSFYVVLNFTRTAALASAAGWCGALYALEKEDWKKGLLPGSLLLLYGCMLRFESWLMVSAVAFVYFCAEQLRTIRPFTKARAGAYFRQKIRYMAALTGVVVLCGVVVIADGLYYRSTEEWRNYKVYNHARSMLVDYGVPRYESNPDICDQLGITQDDLDMIGSWTFADPELLNVHTIQTLADMKEEKSLTWSILTECVHDACLEILHTPLFLMGLFFIIAAAMLSRTPCLGGNIALLGISLLLMTYLFYEGRVMGRVTNGLAVAFGLFVLMSLREEWLPAPLCGQPKLAAMVAAAVFSCLMLNGTLLLDVQDHSHQHEVFAARQQEKSEIQEALPTENLYLADTLSRIYYFQLFSYWEGIGDFMQPNVYSLGSSYTMHPAYNDILERYGVDNPFRALYEKDNVFLIDSANYESKRSYIQRHYTDNVTLSTVDSVLGRPIFAATAISGPVDAELNTAVQVDVVQVQAEDDQPAAFYDLTGSVGTAGVENAEQLCYYLELSRDDTILYFRFIPDEETGNFTMGIPVEELEAGTYQMQIVTKQKEELTYVWYAPAGELLLSPVA